MIAGIETKFISDSQGFAVEGWVKGRKGLEALMEIECLHGLAEDSLYSLSAPDRSLSRPLISRNDESKLTSNLKSLKTTIKVLLKLHDCLEMGDAGSGIDIKIPQKVIEIRANLTTCKMQEEMLEEFKRKGEVMDETIAVFKKMKQITLDKCVEELENDIKPLKDGEERDKVKRTIELLHDLMGKGE